MRSYLEDFIDIVKLNYKLENEESTVYPMFQFLYEFLIESNGITEVYVLNYLETYLTAMAEDLDSEYSLISSWDIEAALSELTLGELRRAWYKNDKAIDDFKYDKALDKELLGEVIGDLLQKYYANR